MAEKIFVWPRNRKVRLQISELLSGRARKFVTCKPDPRSEEVEGSKEKEVRLLMFPIKRNELQLFKDILECDFFSTDDTAHSLIPCRNLDFGEARMEIFHFLKANEGKSCSTWEISKQLRLDLDLVTAVIEHFREKKWLK